MHVLLHLISRTELSYDDIDRIMEPYYEGNVYKYNPVTEEYDEPALYPQFTWDYYTVHRPLWFPKVEDCGIIIDPNGHAIARSWWNGKDHVNQYELFDSFIVMHRHRWDGCYMYEIDIHW